MPYLPPSARDDDLDVGSESSSSDDVVFLKSFTISAKVPSNQTISRTNVVYESSSSDDGVVPTSSKRSIPKRKESIARIEYEDSSSDDDLLFKTSRRSIPKRKESLAHANYKDSSSEDVVRPRRRTRSSTLSLLVQDEGEDDGTLRAPSDTESRDDSSDTHAVTDTEEEDDKRTKFIEHLENCESSDVVQRLYPRSLHPGFVNTQPVSCERDVVREFLEEYVQFDPNPLEPDDYHIFEVRAFRVYRSISAKSCPGQLEHLHTVSSEQDSVGFCFDGQIEHEGTLKYVENAHIKKVSIEGYQDTKFSTTRDHITIQTRIGFEESDVWYKLTDPAPEYNNCFEEFLWVADLTKHFVDYLTSLTSPNRQDASLRDFGKDFIDKLYEWHGTDEAFLSWHKKCGLARDLRKHIARHAMFLYDQVNELVPAKERDRHNFRNPRLFKHPIWEQICPATFSSRIGPADPEERTVVTENVMNSFCKTFPQWGKGYLNLLDVVEPSDKVKELRRRRQESLGFPSKLDSGRSSHDRDGIPLTALKKEEAVEGRRLKLRQRDVVGRVVIARRSKFHSNHRRFTASYAFVRESLADDKLRVVWLLEASETMCEDAFYPVGNELFISDECNRDPISIADVLGSFDATLFANQANEGATFFIREKCVGNNEGFVTAQKSDLQCSCDDHSSSMKKADGKPPAAGRKRHGKLKTISLFSGCGLFDRALEEDGILETKLAIDFNACAMQSYAANESPTSSCTKITGSVNYCLRSFMDGSINLPPGECIVAGCPCQGFSRANTYKDSRKSQRNCSMVASTISYAEIFLPLYLLIENVPDFDQGPKSACKQAICCLVTMGYQITKAVLDAKDFGAAQSRKRLFLLAVAPGLPVPHLPTSNGDDIGKRATAADAARGLNRIHDETMVNILFPDHIPVQKLPSYREQKSHGKRKKSDGKRWANDVEKKNSRFLVGKIPIEPPGMNLYKTWEAGLLTDKEVPPEKRNKTSKSLGRLTAAEPFPTLMTSASPMCMRYGRCLHWSEDRVYSLQESMNAQGFRKDDVLIGSVAEQAKQSGNGVAWPVGAALGRCIGRSWIRSPVTPSGISSDSTSVKSNDRQRRGRSTEHRLIKSVEDTEHDRTKSELTPLMSKKSTRTPLRKGAEPTQPEVIVISDSEEDDSHTSIPIRTTNDRPKRRSRVRETPPLPVPMVIIPPRQLRPGTEERPFDLTEIHPGERRREITIDERSSHKDGKKEVFYGKRGRSKKRRTE